MLISGITLAIGALLQLNSNVAAGTNPVVCTEYGKVEGITQLSRDKREFASFRGIPYAAPPIGELRFKAPIAPNKWTHNLNASVDASSCMQKNYLFATNPPVTGSEDCLYVNVYSPNNLTDKKAKKYPVMVFIHYGGFMSGSSESFFVGPDYLMDKDIVLVTFNYRLGVLGFYSTFDDAAPGNFGFKDQVAALKWVQTNIHAFGGDKKQVTIFGESAGGASVHHHILSQSSKGLFHRAISESGTALAPLFGNPTNSVQQQADLQQTKFVNCDQNVEDTFATVACLRKLSATELVESSAKFKYFTIEPIFNFLPVVEKKTKLNPNPFILQNSFDIIKSGKYNKVPWMTGVNSDEGMLRAESLVRQSETLKELNEHFDEYLPKMLLEVNSGENKTFDNIKDFYFNGKSSVNVSDPASIQGLINVYTDRFFAFSLYQSVELHLKHCKTMPIWVYNLAYKGKYTYGDLLAATTETVNFNWGVSHADDLLYLFSTPAVMPPLPETDTLLSRAMIDLWTNFAIYGNPVKSVQNNTEMVWNPTTLPVEDSQHIIRLQFLNITGPYPTGTPFKMEMNNNFLSDRMNFWRKQNTYENSLFN